jgi:hypothetical protein
MATYRFQVRKHIRDDMYKTETIEVELSDSEYKNIKSDDSKYSKGSALLSSKLGESVQSMGFPTEIKSSKGKSNEEGKAKKKKSSLWRPLWAMPFKLIWRLFTGF